MCGHVQIGDLIDVIVHRLRSALCVPAAQRGYHGLVPVDGSRGTALLPQRLCARFHEQIVERCHDAHDHAIARGPRQNRMKRRVLGNGRLTGLQFLALRFQDALQIGQIFNGRAQGRDAGDGGLDLSSGGVNGGALIIIGEDYGEGSSIMQERSHAFAMKSQIWLLDSRPNLPMLVRMVEQGFELSEATNTPVMLEVRIRTCHVHGQFVAKDNEVPTFTLRQAIENRVGDVNRIVLPPASFLQEKQKLEKRWPAAIDFVKSRHLDELLGPSKVTSASSYWVASTIP